MAANDRVILIKGDASKWYDQAIFIVNKDIPAAKIPKDFVNEAEDIIFSYMNKSKQTIKTYAAQAAYMPPVKKPAAAKPAKKNRFDTVLNILMLLGCIAIAAVFLFGIMG
jgi:hypothetical protein